MSDIGGNDADRSPGGRSAGARSDTFRAASSTSTRRPPSPLAVAMPVETDPMEDAALVAVTAGTTRSARRAQELLQTSVGVC